MNFQTFMKQNSSSRSQSLSLRQLQQSNYLTFQKNHPNVKASVRQIQKGDYENISNNQHQNNILKDTSNKMYKNRAVSVQKSDDEYFTVGNKVSMAADSAYKSHQKIENISCKQLLYLIKNEKEWIGALKQTIQSDKQKIQHNLTQLKQQINNMLDDLKLAISVHLDKLYKTYVNEYASIKQGYTKYCQIKKQFWQQNEGIIQKGQKQFNQFNQFQYPGFVKNGKNQNYTLINNLFSDLKHCKQHQNYLAFQQVQHKLLKPLISSSKSILKQLSIKSYYKPQSANLFYQNLRKTIQQDLHQINERMDIFLSFYGKSQQEKVTSKEVKREHSIKSQHKKVAQNIEISSMKLVNEQHIPQQKCKITDSYDQQAPNQITLKQIKKSIDDIVLGSEKQSIGTNDKKYNSTAQSSGTIGASYKRILNKNQFNDIKDSIGKQFKSMNNFQINTPQFNNCKKMQTQSTYNKKYNTPLASLQCCPNLSDNGNNMMKVTQDQTAICLALIKNNAQIAVGTKNGKIKIFCLKKAIKLLQLNSHKASICSLASVSENILASGGDRGCHQLILWNLSNYSKYHTFNNCHKEAITSIVSLQDGKYIATGSFDNVINIYNYKNKQLNRSVDTGQKITLLTTFELKNDEKYIISAHLNLELIIWKIFKNNFNHVIGLEKINKININTIPYSISPIGYETIAVSGKDAKVKIIDVKKGVIERESDIGQCYELVPISIGNGNGNQNDSLLLGCMKNGKIIALQVQRNEMMIKYEMNGESSLSYSCGVGPKVQLNAGLLYIPNHRNRQTQINVWRVEMVNESENGGGFKVSARTL